MSSVREKIIGYLAAGVSQTLAAEAAGVSDSYVSQLLEQEGVREEIASKKSVKLEGHIEIDDSIELAEKLALKQMVRRLQNPLTTLKEATAAFAVANSARKKADLGANGNNAGSVDHVVFVLPKAAKIMIQVNSDNQIIEVDGRTTAPLPSKVLPQMQKRLELQKTMELLPHVVDIKEKARVHDQERAANVLRDITTVIDGVAVVI